ncbi:hypothetical protein, partial [Tateyamaria pelophila]|uniref:hypothetical protein n=1 Tax=Tateyamaria pelophila TaxID=328415 RepID=UPI001CBF2DD4
MLGVQQGSVGAVGHDTRQISVQTLKRFVFDLNRKGFTGSFLSDSLPLGGGSWANHILWTFGNGFARMW